MRKKIAVPIAIGAGVVAVTPRMFKRAWRPPQRDVHQSPADFGLPEDQVWINNRKGIQLHGWFVPADADGPAPAVVVLHGWGGNAAHMLDLAPSIHGRGLHALYLDARNHGLSDHDDHVSMIRFAEDLESAVQYLKNRENVGSVSVVAHSVGAAASIYSASFNQDVAAVVAVASFAHPGELMADKLPLPNPIRWAVLKGVERMIGLSFDEIAPRNRIRHVAAPIMLVHGDADSIVPVKDSIELHSTLPGSELLIVPDGNHADLKPFEPYFDQIMDFLEENSSNSTTP